MHHYYLIFISQNEKTEDQERKMLCPKSFTQHKILLEVKDTSLNLEILFKLIFMKQFLHNVLVSAAQLSESAMCMHVFPLF